MGLLANAITDQLAFAAATDLEVGVNEATTVWMWVKIADGFTAGARLFAHGTSGAGGASQINIADGGSIWTFDGYLNGGTPDPFRTSGPLQYDKWYFIASTHVGTSASPRLWVGTETTPVVEDTTNPGTDGVQAGQGAGTVAEFLNYPGFSFGANTAALSSFGYIIGTASSQATLEAVRAAGRAAQQPTNSVIFCPNVNDITTVRNDASSNVGDGTVTSLSLTGDPSIPSGIVGAVGRPPFTRIVHPPKNIRVFI